MSQSAAGARAISTRSGREPSPQTEPTAGDHSRRGRSPNYAACLHKSNCPSATGPLCARASENSHGRDEAREPSSRDERRRPAGRKHRPNSTTIQPFPSPRGRRDARRGRRARGGGPLRRRRALSPPGARGCAGWGVRRSTAPCSRISRAGARQRPPSFGHPARSVWAVKQWTRCLECLRTRETAVRSELESGLRPRGRPRKHEV